MKNLKVLKKKGTQQLVFTGTKTQEINLREYNAIKTGAISGLILFEIVQEQKPVILSSDLGDLVPVKEHLERAVLSKSMFCALIKSAIGILEALKKSFFNLNLLLYNPQSVYIDPNNWELHFVYIPVQPYMTEEKPRDFFKGIIRYASFDQTENTDYVQNYIQIINEGADVSLFVLKEFINVLDQNVDRADSTLRCPKCNSFVSSGDTSCGMCGYSLQKHYSQEDNQKASTDRHSSFSVNEDESGLITVFRAGNIKKAYLVNESGNETIPISKIPFRIGKLLDTSDHRIENNAVSRKHADIVKENDIFYVIDLYSTNGTYVNGKRIQSGVKEKIADQDIVCFANAKYTFIIE